MEPANAPHDQEISALSEALNVAMASGDGVRVEALVRGCPSAAAFTRESSIPIDNRWATSEVTMVVLCLNYAHSAWHIAGSPIAIALAFGRPDWAEMMLDAGGYGCDEASFDLLPLRVAAGGGGRILCRNPSWGPAPPQAGRARRIAVFKRLVSILAPRFDDRRRLRLRVACGSICADLIGAGEPEMDFLAELLAVWKEPECYEPGYVSECELPHYQLSRLVPYREYARRIGQGRVVDWVGTRACRAAWIGAVVRAALAAPRS